MTNITMTTGDQSLYSECITTQDDPRALLPLLKSHLPHSIPLLRRLQHNLAFPSETARLLTTFPGVEPPSEPWLAAYVDLPRGRETQMTIYSSLERQSAHEDNDDNIHKDNDYKDPLAISTLHAPPETLALVRAQLLALLSYTKTTLLPGYLSSLTAPGIGTRPSGPTDAPGQVPPPPPQAFLIGNLHTGLMALLKASGIYIDPEPVAGIRIHRHNPVYVKYLFRGAHAHSDIDAGLPPGYRFHDRQGRTGILPHHYALIRGRTYLPRSDETMSRIPGVAAYVDGPGDGEEEMPIAWVFLGLDGSLATLYVEPEHRGKGIAEAVSREVIRRGMAEGGIWREVGEEGELWVHANVLANNGASRRVLEKLGGEVGWTVKWTVVELES
jgi:GNAT superfamily N-acetyltransferase